MCIGATIIVVPYQLHIAWLLQTVHIYIVAMSTSSSRVDTDRAASKCSRSRLCRQVRVSQLLKSLCKLLLLLVAEVSTQLLRPLLQCLRALRQLSYAGAHISVHTHFTASEYMLSYRTSANTTDGDDSCPREVTCMWSRQYQAPHTGICRHVSRAAAGNSKAVSALTMLCNSAAERS
jgi:hypothetical protein